MADKKEVLRLIEARWNEVRHNLKSPVVCDLEERVDEEERKIRKEIPEKFNFRTTAGTIELEYQDYNLSNKIRELPKFKALDKEIAEARRQSEREERKIRDRYINLRSEIALTGVDEVLAKEVKSFLLALKEYDSQRKEDW